VSSVRPTTVAVAATAGLLMGGVAYAALYPSSQIFGPVLVAGNDPRELALTYDDGPNSAVTPKLLELLAAHGARATFFLIGRFVQRESALTREIATAGHLIGNHTMTHPRLAWQSALRIRHEIRETNSILEDVLGAPVRLFRPPHGARRPLVIQVARELGLSTVQWNVTAADWKPIDAGAIARNVERGITRNQRRGRGSNLLFHDGSHHGLGADRLATIAATASVLRSHIRDHFVTVDVWEKAPTGDDLDRFHSRRQRLSHVRRSPA